MALALALPLALALFFSFSLILRGTWAQGPQAATPRVKKDEKNKAKANAHAKANAKLNESFYSGGTHLVFRKGFL